jgi:hypothetical protein
MANIAGHIIIDSAGNTNIEGNGYVASGLELLGTMSVGATLPTASLFTDIIASSSSTRTSDANLIDTTWSGPGRTKYNLVLNTNNTATTGTSTRQGDIRTFLTKNAAGTLTTYVGHSADATISAGTVSTYIGFLQDDIVTTGATVTDAYAFYCGNLGNATNKWAFYNNDSTAVILNKGNYESTQTVNIPINVYHNFSPSALTYSSPQVMRVPSDGNVEFPLTLPPNGVINTITTPWRATGSAGTVTIRLYRKLYTAAVTTSASTVTTLHNAVALNSAADQGTSAITVTHTIDPDYTYFILFSLAGGSSSVDLSVFSMNVTLDNVTYFRC